MIDIHVQVRAQVPSNTKSKAVARALSELAVAIEEGQCQALNEVPGNDEVTLALCKVPVGNTGVIYAQIELKS